jgi:Fe-S-cluster containining protein
VQIEKPVTKKETDQVRWYLLHENVWVSIDHDGDWLLEFRTPCRKIQNNKCGDYENRPAICRDYPGENELCERATDEESYAVLFTNESEFEEYLKKNDLKKTALQTRMKKNR